MDSQLLPLGTMQVCQAGSPPAAQVSLEGQGTAEVPHCLEKRHLCDSLSASDQLCLEPRNLKREERRGREGTAKSQSKVLPILLLPQGFSWSQAPLSDTEWAIGYIALDISAVSSPLQILLQFLPLGIVLLSPHGLSKQ